MIVPMKSNQNKAECPRGQDNADEGQDVIFWIGTMGERMCVLHMESTYAACVYFYIL